MIARESFPLSSTFWSADQRKSIRGPWYFERKRRLECVKSEQTQREEREGRRKERKVKERSSCVYRMRVEFYACLIWKWIAREYASMRRVEETDKRNRHGRKRERGRKRGRKRTERERKRERNRWLFHRLSPSLHLPFSLFFPPFMLSLLPSRATRTGQQTARKRENNFLRSRFITQITHLYRTLKTRYV